MSWTAAERRLAAILSADVVGYSRLMQQDDQGTLAALAAARQLFAESTGPHGGRVVNAPGDSILVEFASVVEAVECAISLQASLAKGGLQFRIGVNVGDVLVDEAGAIYGDGVNIAARLEGLASPGGICVSKPVYDQVKGRVRAGFEDLGEKTVKNIDEPVRVYRAVLGAPSRAAPVQAPKPNSIAVLAFDNMTGDPAHELFCDGISEDIITDLSKTRGVAVIGRQSSFTFKGKATDARAIGRELGVQYVLEGSVRMAGNRVRVTAQLVEAQAGTHLWANRYDRELDDVFAVGDEITEDIVTALDVRLSGGEEARIWRKAMRSRQARDLFNEALNIRDRGTPQDMQRARELLLEAARLEPVSPWPLAYAAVTHALELMNGWTADPARSLQEARRLALESLQLEQTVAGAYATLGVVALFEQRHDEALVQFERSREVRPMCAGPRAFLSYGQLYSGLWEKAAQNATEAVELNPVFPLWYRYLAGAARHFSGRHDEGLLILQNVKAANPSMVAARLAMIHAQMALGRREQAEKEAAALLKDRPEFSVGRFAQSQPFRDKALRERYLDSLRVAGLPD